MTALEDYKEEFMRLFNEACMTLSIEEYEELTEWLRDEGFV